VADFSFNPESPEVEDSADLESEGDDLESEDDSAELLLLVDLAAGRASRASFLAHPLPLKTIAGVESSLRIGPPQRSQAVGPESWIPWMTSTRWPQLRHS